MSRVDLIRDDRDEIKLHTYEFCMVPRRWQAYPESWALEWRKFRLSIDQRQNIPMEPGVYTLLVEPGIANHAGCSYLVYVGKAESGLRNRFNDYLREVRNEEGRPHIIELLSRYPDHLWFCFSPVPRDQCVELERALIHAYRPPFNDQIPAQVLEPRSAF
jgi:hypothetical protein